MNKSRQRLQGTVQKVIQPLTPGQPEKAEILIDQADELFREIRVANVFTRIDGDFLSRILVGCSLQIEKKHISAHCKNHDDEPECNSLRWLGTGHTLSVFKSRGPWQITKVCRTNYASTARTRTSSSLRAFSGQSGSWGRLMKNSGALRGDFECSTSRKRKKTD